MLTRLTAFALILAGLALCGWAGMLFFQAKEGLPQVVALNIALGGFVLTCSGLILETIVRLIQRLRKELQREIFGIAADVQQTLTTKPTLFAVQQRKPTAPAPAPVVQPEGVHETPQRARYFYGDAEMNEHGPFSFEEIRELARTEQISSTTPVYRSGTGKWATLADFPDLA